jgi:diacylglycerol kinase family enzyme
MAGGDGSQAPVAQVAPAHDLAFVCVPVGTRNHFAKDLGLDPGDPVGALDAFGNAEEIRIDLGLVADRVVVNNVSFGAYAMIVGTEGYRENKPETAWQVLPSVLGPEADPVDLRFTSPDGLEQTGFQLILVSNDPYHFTADSRLSRGTGWISAYWGSSPPGGRRRRLPCLRRWVVGGTATSIGGVAALAGVRVRGPISWPDPRWVDGEALGFDPPVRLWSLPGALRVHVPTTGRTAT